MRVTEYFPGCKVTKDVFLDCSEKIHRDMHDREMTIEEVENEEIKFKQIDRDDNGHLIWRDFLNYHSIMMLQRRTKV